MNKDLKLVTSKVKLKCLVIMVLAIVSLVIASVWLVRLGELYTAISGGGINTIAHGVVVILSLALIYLADRCITILRSVLLDCVIATHEADVRETSVEKLLKMPVSYYVGCLSREKTSQLNQGVAGLSQCIKHCSNDIYAIVLTAVCVLIQVIFNASVIMAGIMFMYLAVTILISASQICSQNGIREKIIKQKNDLNSQICRSISNLELIRSMDAEDYKRVRFQHAICKVSATRKKHHRYMGAFEFIKQNYKIIFQIIILMASIVLVADGKMSAGAVVSVCMLFQQMIKPTDGVYRFMDETTSSVVLLVVCGIHVKKKQDDGDIHRFMVINIRSQRNNIVIRCCVMKWLGGSYVEMFLAWSLVPQNILPPKVIFILGYSAAMLIRFVKEIKVEQKMYLKSVLTIAVFLFFVEVINKIGDFNMIVAYLQANITSPKLLIMAIMVITFMVAGGFSAGAAAIMLIIVQLCEDLLSSQSDWIAVVYAVAICAGGSCLSGLQLLSLFFLVKLTQLIL